MPWTMIAASTPSPSVAWSSSLPRSFMAVAGARHVGQSGGSAPAGAPDGPQSGYFPVLHRAADRARRQPRHVRGQPCVTAHRPDLETFVERAAVSRRAAGAAPDGRSSSGCIGFIGIYVASALFIAYFMRWLGRYPLAAGSCRWRSVVPFVALHDVRGLVPGAAAEGPARELLRLLSAPGCFQRRLTTAGAGDASVADGGVKLWTHCIR